MSKHNEVPKIEVNCRFSLKLVWSLNSRSISAFDFQTISVCAIFCHLAEKLACLALSTWANSVVVTFWFLLRRYTKCIRVRDTNGWLVICDFEGHIVLHGRMGPLFALWTVSPHSSHIAVSVRGQSFRWWPFGSSVPWQLVHVCSGQAKLIAFL
jgi:hypothetical protein